MLLPVGLVVESVSGLLQGDVISKTVSVRRLYLYRGMRRDGNKLFSVQNERKSHQAKYADFVCPKCRLFWGG